MPALKRLLTLACLLLAGCSATTVNLGERLDPGPLGIGAATLARLDTQAYSAREIHFPAADGGAGTGVLVARQDAPAVVLYIGGGDFTPARDAAPVARDFEVMGLDVLILEYPAVGGSPEAHLDAARMSALGAYDYLDLHSRFAKLPVIVHGYDVGSLVATYLARQRAISGLVLEDAPTTLRDWARADAPWYAHTVRVKKGAPDYDNLRAVNSYAGPLLLLAGGADQTTPPIFARTLYRFALTPRTEKRLVLIPDAGHGQELHAARAQAAYEDFARRIAGAHQAH